MTFLMLDRLKMEWPCRMIAQIPVAKMQKDRTIPSIVCLKMKLMLFLFGEVPGARGRSPAVVFVIMRSGGSVVKGEMNYLVILRYVNFGSLNTCINSGFMSRRGVLFLAWCFRDGWRTRWDRKKWRRKRRKIDLLVSIELDFWPPSTKNFEKDFLL